tara:strand:- start:3990 stop:5003 length:1014 start_codon:yes stop_codon:yes gene_type:complete
MVKCMADPLDKILANMNLLPSDIEQYCARYGNIKLLRNYNKLHSDLVKYAVKGDQLAILKFLLTQKSPLYEIIKELANTLTCACIYNKVNILEFIKKHLHKTVDGRDQWKEIVDEYDDGECMFYATKYDHVDCFIWASDNMHSEPDVDYIYMHDSVKILKYLHSCGNVDTNYTAPRFIKMVMNRSSINCLRYIYSITPFEIDPVYIKNAIHSSDERLVQWFISIVDISIYVEYIAIYGDPKLWDLLTNDQLERNLCRCICNYKIKFIKYYINRKLMTEKLFLMCCEEITSIHTLMSIFDLFVKNTTIGFTTLQYVKNIAYEKGYGALVKRIDDYMSQ